jgi:Flp pilus assembly protein TadG
MDDGWRQRQADIWRRLRSAMLAAGPFSARARHRAWERVRREQGQAMVEFAVILPVLLILVTGIIQFGTLYNKYIVLTDAVRAGARILSVGRGLDNPCDPGVTQALQAGTSIGLTASQVTPGFPSSADYCGTGTYTYGSHGNTGGKEVQGDQATLSATQPFTLSVFGMSVVTLNLTASSSNAVE